MRKLAGSILALSLMAGLAACNSNEPAPAESGTVVQGDEWVADAATSDDVEINLPEAPVAITPAETDQPDE